MLNQKTQTIINNINESAFMQQTKLFCRTFWLVAGFIAPALLSAYLFIVVQDKVVTVMAVAIMVFAIINLVHTAYVAASSTQKKGTKKSK